jgi:deazaflavin-dependent oxidoreductase (nitroreductase family)
MRFPSLALKTLRSTVELHRRIRCIHPTAETKGSPVVEVNDWNAKVIHEFRANDGRVGGQFEGAPVLLLTTTGAKSGHQRVHPLMYLLDDGTVYVFASKGGHPSNPDWYHNLVANPAVSVELGSETFPATARVIAGPDRDRIFARQAELYPGFAGYQEKTSRVIPVVALDRAA